MWFRMKDRWTNDLLGTIRARRTYRSFFPYPSSGHPFTTKFVTEPSERKEDTGGPSYRPQDIGRLDTNSGYSSSQRIYDLNYTASRSVGNENWTRTEQLQLTGSR